MRLAHPARIGVVALALLASGCHLPRPGEVRPQPIAACEAQRIAAIESRFEQATSTERELLTYCRTAQAASALAATQEHVDYIADLEFFGILLGLVTTLVYVVVN